MCPECKSAVISDLYRGETTCEYCGLVISEKALEQGHFEKNIFSREEMRLKGQNGGFHSLFIPKFHFHTIININEISDYNFKRIAGWDKHNDDPESRNLLIAIGALKQISGTLRLPPSVRENAMLLYRKALKKNLIRGRSIVGVVCASIYYACRKSKTPISFKEIIKEGCAKAKKVIKVYMLLAKEFNLKVPPLEPVLFVSRYINELQLSFKIEQKVLSILKSLPPTL